MRFHSVNYREDRLDARALVNRGFWFYLPRPLAACRAFGHKPVIDGYERIGNSPGARWVCCDRCGVRPEPQGCLDPAMWDIGTPVVLGEFAGAIRQPGRTWPAQPEGTIGGQLVVGRGASCGVSVKVGNAGSEHTLAAHVAVPFAGALYLHTERFGTWLQRRLNPVGYESKVIEADVFNGRVHWKLWMPRDGGPRSWRDGSVRVGPRDLLLGETRYGYADVGDPDQAAVRLPDGSEYPVTVQLRRQAKGRAKGRKKLSWTVDCNSPEGIPYRACKGGMCGWAVPVSDAAVAAGLWQQAAAAASTVKIMQLRVRYEWKAPASAPAG